MTSRLMNSAPKRASVARTSRTLRPRASPRFLSLSHQRPASSVQRRALHSLSPYSCLPSSSLTPPSSLTLSQLRHPNIVRFFGVCFTTRAALLITELCSRSLADVILASPDGVSRPEFFRMMDEAAQGLSYLHQRNMVHLDVKPANVLLDSSGTVKLCDFGLTQLRRQQQSGDGEGGGGEGEEEVLVQGGTLPYMSPELLQLSVYSDSVPEESQTIDAKVDARGLDLGKSDT